MTDIKSDMTEALGFLLAAQKESQHGGVSLAIDRIVSALAKLQEQQHVRPSVKMPSGPFRAFSLQGDIRRKLESLKVGGSFEWPENHNPYRAAKTIGITVKTEKINGGYLVWRKS